MRSFFVLLFVAISVTAIPGVARSAELVMFYSPACEWCQLWEEEVGVVYDRTAEGERLPLRRVSIHESRPNDLQHVESIVYTPTFVLMEAGRETGRITGYPGEAHFWGLLGGLMQELPDNGKISFGCGSDMPAHAEDKTAATKGIAC